MSTTTKTAPDSCPFCGAAFKGSTDDGVDREYRCGTWVASEILSPQRTLRCITAERERLTRELSAAKALLEVGSKCIADMARANTDLLARVKQLGEESESRWLLAQSAIGSCAEMSSRVKRLEEAGDELLRDNDDMANISRWHKAKEAKP